MELSRNLRSSLPLNNPNTVWNELAREASATGVSISSLDTLSGVEFEYLITRVLERMGFRAETTKASGDGGVDVVATLDQPLTGGRYLIQCKRYAPDSTVGAATVREFYGALTADRRAIKGILITTSAFTAQATEFAEGLPIELIARDKLQGLLERHGLLHAAIPAMHPLVRLYSAYGSILETLASLGQANSVLVEVRSAWQGMSQAVLNSLRTSLGADVGSGEASQPEDRAKALLASAIKMSEQKRDAEAIKLLREAARLQPDHPDVWLWLGICYNSVGLHDDQIAALREAVRLRPDYEAWYWLGEGLHKVGDLDPAIDALTRANAILPDNVYTWLELGRTYRDKGTKEGALSAFNKAVTIKPDFVPAWFDLGLLHHEQREYREALSAFLEAVRINPGHAPSWKMLVLGHFWIGDYTRMEQAINRLERLDPATAHEYRRKFLKK
jgi:tetratricopeptide (TPR) repeat protein